MLHERVGLASLSADSDNGRVAISNCQVTTVFCAKWGNGNYSTCCKKQPGSGRNAGHKHLSVGNLTGQPGRWLVTDPKYPR